MKNKQKLYEDLQDAWNALEIAVLGTALQFEKLSMIQGMLWLLKYDERSIPLPETDRSLQKQLKDLTKLCKKIYTEYPISTQRELLLRRIPEGVDHVLGSGIYNEGDFHLTKLHAKDIVDSRVDSAMDSCREFAQIRGILQTILKGNGNKKLHKLLTDIETLPDGKANATKFAIIKETLN